MAKDLSTIKNALRKEDGGREDRKKVSAEKHYYDYTLLFLILFLTLSLIHI